MADSYTDLIAWKKGSLTLELRAVSLELVHLPADAASFLTMVRTILRSLSFRLGE